MKKIPFNPYIVGNPIKTREMFFGREDDFQYVAKKIGGAKSNQVLVFCGERRSGKTSILFQILNGRLGERFLPVLVDMQILAGIKNDDHFWRTILKVACDSLQLPDLTVAELEATSASGRVEELFAAFLSRAEQRFPGKIVLFLLDEYELIEEKIRDGSLSESTIHYLSGVLESPHNISFVFTGSTNLEDRKVSFWKSLLGKSIYRKISYLSENDTARLITEPLKGHIRYSPELIGSVYRLSGGQPFYTQVICQNLVDHLMEEQRNDPTEEDLEAIVKGIVDNPLPQMIYSWNSLSEGSKVLLSSLAGVLGSEKTWAGAGELTQYFKHSRLALPYSREEILILLEEAYHREFLEKREENRYRFRLDLLRRWIKREHSIWKVAKEVGVKPKKRVQAVLWAALAAAVLASGIGVWYFLLRIRLPAAGSSEAAAVERGLLAAGQEIDNVVLTANIAPFRVTIDDSLNLTSEGLEDPGRITVPSLQAGSHSFTFHNPENGEQLSVQAEIDEGNKTIEVRFTGSVQTARAAGTGGTGTGARVEGAKQGAQAPPAAARGTLFITSVPVSAGILLDGEDTGLVTPALLEELDPGAHSLVLRLEGFKEASFELEVSAGDTAKQEIELEESFGQVLFDVRPTAKILLDGAPLIETPYVQPVKIRSGEHLISIVNESLGVRKELQIEVREAETLKITEVLK